MIAEEQVLLTFLSEKFHVPTGNLLLQMKIHAIWKRGMRDAAALVTKPAHAKETVDELSASILKSIGRNRANGKGSRTPR